MIKVYLVVFLYRREVCLSLGDILNTKLNNNNSRQECVEREGSSLSEVTSTTATTLTQVATESAFTRETGIK